MSGHRRGLVATFAIGLIAVGVAVPATADGAATDVAGGIGAPMARVTPDELVFPKSMTQQTGFVDSAGTSPLTVTGLSLTGLDAVRFSIDGTTCTQQPIPVTETCTVMVGVSWTDERPLTATLVIASDDPAGDRLLPLRTTPDPQPSPTVTPSLPPTPSPTVTPTPVTQLVVSARPHRKALSTSRPTTVVRSVRANSPVRVRTECLLRGQRVSRKVQQRLCVVRTSALRRARSDLMVPGAGRVTAQPLCSAVSVRVRIRARAAGTDAKMWERSWRADRAPRVQCRVPGTG